MLLQPFCVKSGNPIIIVAVFVSNLNHGKLRFVYKRWKGVDRMKAVVMGTKSTFQKHGLESVLFIKLKEYVLPLNQYKKVELSWVGDFSDKMLALHEAAGATFGTRHATMKKVFDD